MKKLDIYERIKRAFKRKTGMRLSAEDVDTLYLLDTAITDACDGTGEDFTKPDGQQNTP